MDTIRAKKIAKELNGKRVGGWTILDYINNGKAAVILRAVKGEDTAALKIFDPELIERFGKKTQLIRVQREKKLIGKSHPNLIEIKDGGECENTGYIYVAMAYLPWKKLSQLTPDFPREYITTTIQQLADAAKYLEDNGLAHRDIKPDNIIISDDFSSAMLLDLGVLRPFGLSEITDDNEQKVFVGTLRFSPPELLYRKEEDSVEGWRAVTFYQLGAVLHDMIMRRQLFHDVTDPYAALVDAVRDNIPEIAAEDVNNNLILLARSSLVKNPKERLSITNWEQFLKPIKESESIDSIKERISKRTVIFSQQEKDNVDKINEETEYRRFRQLEYITNKIKNLIRDICLGNKECFPRFEINHELKENNSEALIFISFSPSRQPFLLCTGTLVLFISLSDLPDEITKINFLAFASNKNIVKTHYDDFESRHLFSGQYDESIILSKISLILFSFIDKCQECKEVQDVKPVLLGLPLE